MGGERWLLFRNQKEVQRAQAFLAPLDGFLAFDQPVPTGIHLEWTKTRRLEVAYNFTWPNVDLAEFVCREMARRFDITRIGADATGWWPDSDWTSTHDLGAPAAYGAYTSWVTWMKDFKLDWVRGAHDPAVHATYRQLDLLVTARFRKLDPGTNGP